MRFVINRGQPFSCEFVIKQPGASVPLDITGSIGTFTLSTIGINACIVIPATPLTIVDDLAAQNGQFNLDLTAEQTTDLVGNKGFAEDGYQLIATYTGALDIWHPEEGDIFVDIAQIYVKDQGVTCV